MSRTAQQLVVERFLTPISVEWLLADGIALSVLNHDARGVFVVINCWGRPFRATTKTFPAVRKSVSSWRSAFWI
jgi:hypothetical protein